MRIRSKIAARYLLRTIMMLIMMGGASNAWSQEEKVIYQTDFTDWKAVDRITAEDKKVSLKTQFTNENFTFTLNNVGVDPRGVNPSKFSYTGYMITAKNKDELKNTAAIPTAVTSPLKSITKIVLIQTATGTSKRGIKVSVKGDGDSDWVVLHNKTIGKVSASAHGEELSLDVNRTNCQIKFENYYEDAKNDGRNNNAYIVDLKIYGQVAKTSTFKDFRIDFRKNPYTVIYPKDGLPKGVEVTEGTFNDQTHGYKNAKVTVPVYGPTKFSIGGCDNTDQATVSVNGSAPIIIDTKAAGCIDDNNTKNSKIKYAYYIYNSDEKAELTFDLGSLCPLFIAEECEKRPPYLEFEKVEGIEGEYPTKISCDKNGQVTMPDGNLFSLKGYTFEGWTDGTTVYEPGKTYSFTQDVTLIKPKMRKNTYALYDSNKETTVKWNFDHSEAPEINIFGSSVLKKVSYNQPASIYINEAKQETQDLALTVETPAINTRIDNTDTYVNSLPNKGALVYDGTKFSLPAIYGMKVYIHASQKEDASQDNNTTIFGTDETLAQIRLDDTDGDSLMIDKAVITDEGRTVCFTYNGDAQSITLTLVKAGTQRTWGYIDNITVSYPMLPNVVCTKSIINADPTQFPNEKTENAGSVKIELKNPDTHRNTGNRYKAGDIVTITVTPDYGYDFQGFKFGDQTFATTSYEHTVTSGIDNIEVNFKRKEMYKIIVKPSNTTLGSIDISPIYDNFYQKTTTADDNISQVESWYEEGTEVTMTADAIRDYRVDSWIEENGTKHSDNTYTFKVGKTNQTFTADFKLGYVGSVTFDFGSTNVNGAKEADLYNGAISMAPAEIKGVRSFVIPTNFTFFKNINDDADRTYDANYYTLDYWVKKDNPSQKYELGKMYSFSQAEENQTITLVPVFKENPTSHQNRVNNTVIRYDFGRQVQDYLDPTTQETHKVCAQTVNIGKNENVFWTSQAYLDVLDGGEHLEHWRDVAMWCNTGKNGYIRNEDFDDWCAIGPGTTFWVASGTGTKISILSYSPITTTTIYGVVPSLDQVRTDSVRKVSGNSHMYVYSYTTAHSSDRLPIVIGDDYSYYQWIEVNLLAANWVDYHCEVDADARGKIVETTTYVEGNAIKKLENGDYSFHKGERLKLTFNRKKGYELSQIVGLKEQDTDGNPLPLLVMKEDGSVDMINYDFKTYTNCPKNEDGSWGIESGDKKTMWVLKEIDNAPYNTEDSIRTQYELTFDITAHRSLQIQFKEKPTYYITFNEGQLAMGTAPEAKWVEADDKFTIPSNQTLYYEGNTLNHWVDEEGNTYDIGKAYTVKGNKDFRLFPVFQANEFNILDLKENATATWILNKNEGAPTINYEGTEGILVTQLTNSDGQSIDLKVNLDGTQKGKFNNTDANRPERIQINENSIIEFPATPNCEVTWIATSNFDKIEIEGKNITTTSSQRRQVTATCEGKQANATIRFTEGIYSQKFTITYKPQTAIKATIQTLKCGDEEYNAQDIQNQMSTDKHITFHVSPWLNDNETIPDVTGTATQGGKVEATKASIATQTCAVTVRTASGIIVETYPVEFVFNKPDENSTPKFVSVTVNDMVSTQTSNEIKDVPQSGLIKVAFNRTMEASTIKVSDLNITTTSKSGKVLEFKYWDVPKGSTVKLEVTPKQEIFKDIYGMTCQDTLTLILHIVADQDYNHHHKFDFIVGKDGTIDQAIEAANNNKKENNHRYFIFVPDGEYELTGNSTITCATAGDNVPKDEKGDARPEMNGKNNHVTDITQKNISLIGQSKEGVTIWNHPIVEGLTYTATIHIGKNATDFYAEDLTLENRFDYWGSMSGQTSGGAGRAAAFWDQGNRSILKNVALKSWQDTYFSNNANDDYRGYFENSDLYGVVDWLCGNGDIWFEKCNIVIRDRAGNNIAAPSTEPGQDWGYVFNNCTIKPEVERPIQLKGKDWTLARPWGDSNDKIPASPACTFLNTKMYTQPRTYGWNKMGTGLVLRFHEYRSKDASDTQLSLSTRTLAACSPAPGSDDCILSDALASNYTLRNAMGGPDAFEPNLLCQQIDAKSGLTAVVDDGTEQSLDTENHIVWNDSLVINDDMLQWNAIPQALCYFLFKRDENGKWIYQENTTENSINLNSYGSGYYYVRAANQRGGLGSPTTPIQYAISDPYELEIKLVGNYQEDGERYGWTTICLPFNAKKPSEVKVYAATADETHNPETLVTDFTLTLSEVNVIDSLKGYVVYGPVGTHTFHPTSSTCDKPTILSGNATSSAISATNISCYVLANKTWGLGFYKYAGATLAANRGWLPQNMVGEDQQFALASGKKAIRFRFADDTTPIHAPIYTVETEDDVLYNLNGQRVDSSARGGIFISKKKGKIVKK